MTAEEFIKTQYPEVYSEASLDGAVDLHWQTLLKILEAYRSYETGTGESYHKERHEVASKKVSELAKSLQQAQFKIQELEDQITPIKPVVLSDDLTRAVNILLSDIAFCKINHNSNYVIEAQDIEMLKNALKAREIITGSKEEETWKCKQCLSTDATICNNTGEFSCPYLGDTPKKRRIKEEVKETGFCICANFSMKRNGCCRHCGKEIKDQ